MSDHPNIPSATTVHDEEEAKTPFKAVGHPFIKKNSARKKAQPELRDDLSRNNSPQAAAEGKSHQENTVDTATASSQATPSKYSVESEAEMRVVVARPTSPSPRIMSPADRRDYQSQVRIIRSGSKEIATKSIEVAYALLRVQELGLYKVRHDNFAEFCEKECSLGKTIAYGLVAAAKVLREFSATAEFSVLPTNERQVRPLVRLANLESRKAAWARAIAIAAGEPVTEAHVRKAVQDSKPKQDELVAPDPWPSKTVWVKAFQSAGYERTFQQPITWPGFATDLYSEATGQHVKFINVLTLEDLGCVNALRRSSVNCVVVVNGDANSDGGLLPTEEGELVESFSPEFTVEAESLELYVEDNGIIYAPGELNGSFLARWAALSGEQLQAIGIPGKIPSEEIDSSTPDESHAALSPDRGGEKTSQGAPEPVAASVE